MIESADNAYGMPIKKGAENNKIPGAYGGEADSPRSEFDQYGYPKPNTLRAKNLIDNLDKNEEGKEEQTLSENELNSDDGDLHRDSANKLSVS